MRLSEVGSVLAHFIKQFPSDPEYIRTAADIEAIEKIPQEERFPCCSPNEMLTTVAAEKSDDIALTFLPDGSLSAEPQRWTYAEYRQEVIAAANLFHSLGLAPEQSVAFLLPNVPEMLFGIWGAQAVGIAAPINPFLRAEQIAGIAREADAHILIALGDDVELLQKAMDAKREVSSIQHVIAIGELTDDAREIEGTDSVLIWENEIAQQPHDTLTFDRPLMGDEIAAYFHTGGTTGTPKLAQHTQRAEVVNVCQMALTGPAFGGEGEELQRTVILCGLPLFHVNSVFVSVLSAVASGGELVLAGRQGFREKQLIRDFWALVERYRVSFFAGVPTVYAALLEQDSEGFDMSSLKYGSCGAAPMPVSMLSEFCERTGADIMEGYGMTETVVCATSHYYYGPRHIGSIGMRLPYQNMRVVVIGADGSVVRDCEQDEIGVILHSGPNVIPAYKQAFANTDAWPEPGWLNSGDMGRVDTDGYVWLTGRAKDLIIRGGHNIDPMITEEALTTHSDVEMAAAVGMPDAYAGELPVAYVQLRPGATVDADALKAFAREHAAERAGAPAEVFICEELPKTAVGKTFKPPLRKEAIAFAYQRAANNACQGADIQAQVMDDKTQGLKVVLKAGSSDALPDIQSMISTDLDKFAYQWELVG